MLSDVQVVLELEDAPQRLDVLRTSTVSLQEGVRPVIVSTGLQFGKMGDNGVTMIVIRVVCWQGFEVVCMAEIGRAHV